MHEFDIEEELFTIIDDNKLEKINDNIYLTKYQIKVLKDNHIPFTTCKDMSELLFLLSEITDEEELDEVASLIEEFHYYNEVHK